ncbi:MAG: hypothetical protein Q9170_006689 [Blastenia crenularia]
MSPLSAPLATNLTHPQSLRTIHCEVPNTSTVLVIAESTRKVYPHAMEQILTQTQKYIRKKMHESSDHDRPLRPSEASFKVHAWGLEIEVWPMNDRTDPSRPLLTWQSLDETIEGLWRCVYYRKVYFGLSVVITRNLGVVLENLGEMQLQYMSGPVAES